MYTILIIGNKVHPTEKPVELMKYYIENSSKENDIVLDPFMGSGSTGVACLESNRKFVGFEIDENYYQIATDRFNGTKNGKKKRKEKDLQAGTLFGDEI